LKGTRRVFDKGTMGKGDTKRRQLGVEGTIKGTRERKNNGEIDESKLI